MGEDPKVSVTAADAFLDAHPDWPAISRIQSHVEKRIAKNAPASDVLALFQTREPVTGTGKIQLARVHYEKGDKVAGDKYLRDAWINNNFRIAEERKLLSTYGGRLTKEDHAARVDRLLWGRQVTNARRVFSRLATADRREAQARAALLLRASSAPALYNKLSIDRQLDSGMLHAAVRYYRRSGDEPFALSLAEKSPNDPDTLRNPGRWWDERQLLMRWALREGRFADAYAVASQHGLEPGSDYAEAEFNAGWIALRFMNEPKRAETHFLALASSVGTPISLSRAYYWLGRSAAARNEPALAKSYYGAAAKHYYSYYGQLAAEELGGAALAKRFAASATSSAQDRALFSSRPIVAALRKLSDLNLDYEFMVFAYHADDQLTRPGEFVELAKITNGEGAPHLTVRAGKVAIQKNAFTADVAYPLVFVPDEAAKFMAPEIVLGLSRQESEFNPRAFSHAGARGMMQLVPGTALMTARKEGLRYSRSALLDDPVYNMTLGSAHLSHLAARFDGSLIMTFASYNAGQSRVDRWMREYGDPRAASIDPVDWVELIPFSETRNYVQRVLENVQVYRGRLNNAPIPGRLSADLERGGARNRAATAPKPALIGVSAAASQQPMPSLPIRTLNRAQEYAKLRMPEFLAPETLPARVPLISAEAKEATPVSTRRVSRRAKRRAAAAAAAAAASAAADKAADIAADKIADTNTTAPSEPPVAIAAQEKTSAGTKPAAPAPIVTAEAMTETKETPAPEPEPAKPAPTVTQESVTADTVLMAGKTTITANSVNVAVAQTPPATAAPEPGGQALAPPVITAMPTDAILNNLDESDAETATIFPPSYAAPPGSTLAMAANAAAAPPADVAAEDDVSEECRAYREFLAELAGDDAGAADLNAAMLDELQSGVCQ